MLKILRGVERHFETWLLVVILFALVTILVARSSSATWLGRR